MFSLEQVIEGKIAVLIETLNMSVGELVNMYSSKPQELIIHPKYPRSFWWSNEQRSRLIQSIFLGLPLEITTIEDSSEILELIDGKQRLYSMIQFVDASILDLQPLILQGCDLVPELNGNSFNDLPLSMRLNFKRSPIKTAILSINNRGLSMAYTSKLRFSIIKSLTSSEF